MECGNDLTIEYKNTLESPRESCVAWEQSILRELGRLVLSGEMYIRGNRGPWKIIAEGAAFPTPTRRC
jgi:hypothetical protein